MVRFVLMEIFLGKLIRGMSDDAAVAAAADKPAEAHSCGGWLSAESCSLLKAGAMSLRSSCCSSCLRKSSNL